MPEAADYGLKYDEQGKPYYDVPGQPGRRSYVSPVALGGKAPDDTTGIFHSAPQWNQNEGKWETPIDWGNVLNVGVGAGLGLGVADAAFPSLFGAGTGGSVAGDVAGVDQAIANAGAGVYGTGAGLAGGIGKTLLNNLTSTKGIASLASLLPLLMAAKGAGGSGSGTGAATPFANQGQLDSLLNMTVNRAERTDPLHQAVTQLAMSRLPMNVQR